MIRILSTPLILLLASLALCRFTVRDVGFVDLGDEPYQLIAFISANGKTGSEEEFSSLAAAIFAETNLNPRCYDPDEDSDEPAAQYLAEFQIQNFPAAVLVAPDGRARRVEISAKGSNFAESASTCLEALVSSPRRTALLDAVLTHLCVIVIAEGSETKANQTAQLAANEAIADIEKVFDRMPKAVGDLPVVITIPFAEREAEATLLWSLGIDDRALEEPAAVVMFGRARRVGPALIGTAIDGRSLYGILANTGQSCECGLDRSWMRGPRVPLRWDEDTRSRATRLLAFDPDSPMVKAEVSSILARGTEKKDSAGSSVEELLLGYSEESVDLETDQVDPETDQTQVHPPTAEGSYVLIGIGALAILSLLIGTIIMLTRSRN